VKNSEQIHVKLIYIISEVNKALGFEWLYDNINKEQFDITFILLGKPDSAFEKFLVARNAEGIQINFLRKCDFLIAFFQTFLILFRLRPHIVHTHLIMANIIGLTASWILRVPKRIYTRHHAMIHHREHRSGLKYDKWCNWIATDIIAPSKNVRTILTDLEKTPAQKVHLLHHGYDLNYFRDVSKERIAVSTKVIHLSLGLLPDILSGKGFNMLSRHSKLSLRTIQGRS